MVEHTLHQPEPGEANQRRVVVLKRVVATPLRAHSALRRRLGVLGYSFLICVVLPALITLVYLGAFASKEYVSETRFAVRAASEVAASPASDLASMFSSFTGVKSTGQDAFIVIDYIRSRKIVEDLGGRDFAENHYSHSNVDWFSRLPKGETLEDVWSYWRGKVTAIIDTQSNILTVRARAFSPDEAKLIGDKIVQRSETLVNQISERSRKDAFDRAENEVQLAIQRLSKIRESLLRFRNQSNSIDPVASATSFADTLNQLTRDKLELENTRESVRRQLDRDSPIMKTLDTQIASLDVQIRSIQGKLTSTTPNSSVISGQLTDYEDLQLQSQFAEKLFSITQDVFQKARLEQEKQQLYLAMIVSPSMPEEASYPRPFTGTAIVFAVCLVIWSMVSLVIASIGDHIG